MFQARARGLPIRMRVLAFAGIADPAKFFRTVEGLGAEIVVARSFGDHQHLSDDEIGIEARLTRHLKRDSD